MMPKRQDKGRKVKSPQLLLDATSRVAKGLVSTLLAIAPLLMVLTLMPGKCLEGVLSKKVHVEAA